jgi:mono/diheme cytochrome c family protein
MRSRILGLAVGCVVVIILTAVDLLAAGQTPQSADPSTGLESHRALVQGYCVTCHNERVVRGEAPAPSALVGQLRAVGLTLDTLDLSDLAGDVETWEKVVRKLRSGIMPPVGRPRPDEATQDAFIAWLETGLDAASAANPDPGRTATFHRLNRTEYRNAIRDLLAIDLPIVDFLPADDSSFGFDNIGGVLKMSQSLLERYLAAARTVSRLAVGSPPPAVSATTYQTAQDLPQHDRGDGLPFGTRGGLMAEHLFPQDAEYAITVELTGARGLQENHQLEVSIDGEQIELFTLGPPTDENPNTYVNASTFDTRVTINAGPRDVAVAFFARPSVLVEQVREPFPNPRISGNPGGPGGAMPFVRSVTIAGPYQASGSGETPSRDRVFICEPATPSDEPACAQTILTTLARRAYRRPVTDDEIQVLVDFYDDGRAVGGFDDGIELALRRLLVSPEFLYRIEFDPSEVAAGASYAVSDLDLASRLSFFLWSSIPDEALLDTAAAGRLSDPVELERQVRRMLADPRAEALIVNFTGQWLQLRNLAMSVRPGDPYSRAFDEWLRQSMQRETELFFDSIIREDRGVVELLTADYTFLNERLALHYGIPGVEGSHFRRVTLEADSPRRGLLGHGSILTLTSHAIRTSPVLRGKWILNNVLGTPPPDPPPNVPALVDRKTQAKVTTMRDRMAQHRVNPTCAACHAVIDPAGFALENFDAIGRWRLVDESYNPIDAAGALPDGTPFDGVAELREALVRRPDRFAMTVTEKLLTYALGRGLTHTDMPAVRTIVRDGAADDYRLQSIILGIVTSDPFLMRRSDS